MGVGLIHAHFTLDRRNGLVPVNFKGKMDKAMAAGEWESNTEYL